jgi:hypothetical protein
MSCCLVSPSIAGKRQEHSLLDPDMRIVQIENQELNRADTIPTDYHNSTHYLANPSGYTLRRGQQYYENIGIFFNSYAIGVTNNFTLAMGGEIATLLFDQQFPILYISPRFGIPLGKKAGAISLGGTFFTSPEDDFDGFGIFQGAFTIGSRNNNVTIGSGIGFSFEGGLDDEVIPFYFAFMLRISKKLSFVSDNFLVFYDDFYDEFGLLSAAVRIHFKRNGSALNMGLWRPTEEFDDVLALPFVSATIPIR